MIKKIMISLWSSEGRDFQMIMPIVYYLEKNGYKVKIISAWDLYSVDTFKPDLVLFTNIGGARVNIRFAKYLKAKGYNIISLSSEGNYFENLLESFVWGNNKEKVIYEEMVFLWSRRCLNMVHKEYPALRNKTAVSGGIGFDRYKIYSFKEKDKLLKKYNKAQYNKVVGYAGWAFDSFVTDDEIKNITDKTLLDRIGIYKNRFAGYSELLSIKSTINNILKETIKNNPDILFILKMHPGIIDDDNTEIRALCAENVLILKIGEEIADIINICDIWMGFDSTSALEAWLLNKPTINICTPTKEITAQNMSRKGSITIDDSTALQKYINEYYISNKISDFENKKTDRDCAIEEIIQWGDGLNHVRAGKEIINIIEHLPAVKTMNDGLLTRSKLFLIHLLKKNSKYLKRFHRFNKINFVHYQVREKDIQAFKKKYYPDFHRFYMKNKTNINNVSVIFKNR